MKLQLAALIGALAITNPAYAQGTSHLGGKATLANNTVIQAILDSGFTVVMNDPDECANENLMGAFITYHGGHKPDFLVCVNNHESYSALYDTIRHEAHHAVVWCNGGKTFLSWEENLEAGTPKDVGMLYKHYEQRHHHEELEARNVARVLTSEQVAKNVRTFCM